MSKATPRVGITYPSQHEDPYYEPFSAGMNDLDALTFAPREDRNILFTGGGVFTFNSEDGTLEWGGEIAIRGFLTGFSTLVAAGSVTVNDGEVVYCEIARAPTEDGYSTMTVSPYLPQGNDVVMMVARVGDTLYFRGQQTMVGGDSRRVFEQFGGGGGLGTIGATGLGGVVIG